MTRDECSQMLTLLRTAYPGFYRQMKAEEGHRTLDLWEEMFAGEDCAVVRLALKDLIATHTGYPPDIAAVKERIRAILDAVQGGETDEELWRMLARAASNGIYGAREEFERLPPILQQYCGSPSTLQTMALLDSQTFSTVTRGQFLRQIRYLRQREECSARLPGSVRDALAPGGGIDRFRLT